FWSPASSGISTLSLHDALPISGSSARGGRGRRGPARGRRGRERDYGHGRRAPGRRWRGGVRGSWLGDYLPWGPETAARWSADWSRRAFAIHSSNSFWVACTVTFPRIL